MTNSVTFPPQIGGDGSTVDDSVSDVTGLANGGFRIRLLPAFTQFINICNYVIASVQTSLATIQSLAASAINSPGTSASSSDTRTPSLTTLNFTIQTGKALVAGQFVTGFNSPTNNFAGQITAYNPANGALSVLVSYLSSAPASASAWTFGLTAPVDNTLTGRVAALETAVPANKDEAFINSIIFGA